MQNSIIDTVATKQMQRLSKFVVSVARKNSDAIRFRVSPFRVTQLRVNKGPVAKVSIKCREYSPVTEMKPSSVVSRADPGCPEVRLKLRATVQKRAPSFRHPYLAALVKRPFVPFNKDRITRCSFEWQNKFVESTTGPLVANLNRMWCLFRQFNDSIRKQDWSMFHITGGPGVGKSRYGSQLLHSLKSSFTTMDPLLQKLVAEAADNGHYAFISMSNYDDRPYIRKGGSITNLIVAKLADLHTNDILGTVKLSDFVKFVNRTFRPATAQNPLLLQVHIDEIQAHLATSDLWAWDSSLHRLVSGFMDLSFELAKHHIFLMVVTSGSLDLSLKGSFAQWDYPIQKLLLEPISDKDAIGFLATRRKFNPENQAFQQLIKAQGGLLRLLERLDEILAKYPSDAALQENFSAIWQSQLEEATLLFPPPPEEVFELALIGKQLGEDTRIYDSPFYAFELNETFYRQKVSVDRFKLFYPFTLVCAWSIIYDVPLRVICRSPNFPMTVASSNFGDFAEWYRALLEKKNEPSFDKDLPREQLLEYLSPSLSYLRNVEIIPDGKIGVEAK